MPSVNSTLRGGTTHDEDGDDLYQTEASAPEASPNAPNLMAESLVETPDDEATRKETAASLAALNGPPSTVSPVETGTGSGTKRKPTPKTTSRKTKSKTVRISVGCRVKCKRGVLFLLLTTDSQKATIKGFNQQRNCFGTIVSGNAGNGYNVKFDDLPVDEKDVFVKRKNLVPVEKGTEEEKFDHANDDPEVIAEKVAKKQKKKSPFQESVDDFIGLDNSLIADAKTYDMRYNEGGDKVTWTIHADDEFISTEEDPMSYPEKVDLKKEIDYEDSDLADVLFDHFFPCIKGHAEKIDKYHRNKNSPYYQTVKKERIIFHNDGGGDPDIYVKQCYLLMIAAASEAETGVENLWKRGKGSGRRDHADFGQYLPMNMFKAFICCAPLMFGPEELWFTDRRDMPWEMFVPAVDSYNKRRQELFQTVLFMLDESMSGWCPKNSKTGGLPNITYEPRKPVPLGTMLRNGVECITGCLVNQDLVMQPEKQNFKDYVYSDVQEQVRETTSLPGSPVMPGHAAEVLRQVRDAKVERGGWCGGDAWFGSVATCVELKKRLGVHSTFIMKNNKHFFPIEALMAVLTARHGDRPAGHWVTMTTEIAGVKLIAMAYAWSQKGVSYFISTCGSTEPSEIKYESKFEDAWGNTCSKMLNRPRLCHFIYEYLPLIDEHNKQRQNLLALEKCWLTKDCWTRLLTTLLGQSIVDMQRHWRYQQIEVHGESRSSVDQVRIHNFADRICASLRPWGKPRRHFQDPSLVQTDIERITNKDGTTTRNLSKTQSKNGRRTGNSVTLNCWICRGFADRKGKPIQYQTSWRCKNCHAPLCNVDRTQDKKFGPNGRSHTCMETHWCARGDSVLACNEFHTDKKIFPKKFIINQHPRRSGRSNAER
ncbi:unknown protein [Seminavis robusta]|uniref:PiggyBac transposable element-derived protein domain-containing protein n=1 Tax=Seminavis robusta TaxID=568900 RepID=A0A9N8DAQ4_9STRA|nr:unknown protein [Seminavis robusta]|eukprot:Sro56_g032650.1 n/a (878) ;mRNA; f:26810-29443